MSCTSKIEKERIRLQQEVIHVCAIEENIQIDPSRQNVLVLLDKISQLKVSEKLSNKQQYAYLKSQVDSIREYHLLIVQDLVSNIKVTLDYKNDWLMDPGSYVVAKRLCKGDKLFINYNSTAPIKLHIHNADTKQSVKRYDASTNMLDSLTVPNTAIYLVEFINPCQVQYISYEVYEKCQTIENFVSDFNVQEEEVPATPQDYLAYYRNEYGLLNLYEKPRQYTLRGGWKSTFGGHKRTILPLNVPHNCVNVAYQLRIDTSDGVASADGNFYQELNSHCSSVKILGATVREKNESHTSLLREVLNAMKTPQRVEEAYCSMYVFYDENSAREFINLGKTEKCDINHSIIGTQSCNGNIPTNKHKNIYLGFENDQFSGSIYLWVEAVATTTQTNYYTKHYF